MRFNIVLKSEEESVKLSDISVFGILMFSLFIFYLIVTHMALGSQRRRDLKARRKRYKERVKRMRLAGKSLIKIAEEANKPTVENIQTNLQQLKSFGTLSRSLNNLSEVSALDTASV